MLYLIFSLFAITGIVYFIKVFYHWEYYKAEKMIDINYSLNDYLNNLSNSGRIMFFPALLNIILPLPLLLRRKNSNEGTKKQLYKGDVCTGLVYLLLFVLYLIQGILNIELLPFTGVSL